MEFSFASFAGRQKRLREFFAINGFIRPQDFVAEFFYDWFVAD